MHTGDTAAAGASAARVNIDFVDLLYAVPVAVLATRVGETHLEHVGAGGWADILLALIALTLGWVGHHSNRRRKDAEAPDRRLTPATFTELPFWQFWVEVLVIGGYFALSTRLALPGDFGVHKTELHWKASWIVALFVFYLLWDVLDVLFAYQLENEAEHDVAGLAAAVDYARWARRAILGGVVTGLFLLVFLAVRFSAPGGQYSPVPFDIACIVLLYGYRVSQQLWHRERGYRSVGAAVAVVVLAGFTGPLRALFSAIPDAVAISRLQPSEGPAAGGTTVTVSGKDFEPGNTEFWVGRAHAGGVRCRSGTQCTLVTPAGPAGSAAVVATLHGFRREASKVTRATRFTYVLPVTKQKAPTARTKRRRTEGEDVPDPADR